MCDLYKACMILLKDYFYLFLYNIIFLYFPGDSGDLNCWEALADAYLARGSFTAAHKAYEKVLQMNPGSEYTRLRRK